MKNGITYLCVKFSNIKIYEILFSIQIRFIPARTGIYQCNT